MEPIDEDPSLSSNHSSSSSEEVSSKSGESEHLAKRETVAVNRSKLLVYLVLLVAAVAVGVGAYFYVKREETDDFEEKFKGYSKELLEGAERNAKDIFGELFAVSRTLTSFMLSVEASPWPNATLPQFDIRTTPAFESFSGPELFFFAPIVTRKQKKAWEEYAWEHQGWIEDDLHYRGLKDSVHPGQITKRIYPFFSEDEYDLRRIETYVPLWQVAPVPTNASILMMDLYSHPSFRRMIDDALDVRHMLLSEVVDYSFLTENIQTLDQNRERDSHPRSYGLQPVYDGFEADSNIVGFLFAIIPWNSYFVNLLSADAKGLLVEIQDTCDSKFTYKVTGPNAEYLGPDFLHVRKFRYLEKKVEFAEFARFDGVKANDYVTHCSYTVTAYPTDEFKATYTTTDPVIFPVVLMAVFIFTALVFILYDCMVQRRQDMVMATATRTQTLVSSLFPKAVQDRILDDAQKAVDEEQKSKTWKSFAGLAPKTKIKNFLQGEDVPTPGELLQRGRPIADLFPSASVLFADLVGFTAWSSVRDPSQVFQLLETLYNAFDEIAKSRRVYKVETIGDCWVGACGLPEARKDHAVCVARFSRDILNKMGVLVKQLEVELGPDTAELGIRIGIHSGPVTAGVLRGERARFQLFGDTVNTAARMESTGSKNQIHISQETCDLLRAAGKDHWIQERKEKVVAKGKGELQTFWLEMNRAFSSSSGGSSNCRRKSLDNEVPGIGIGYDFPEQSLLSEKHQRLVQWNVEILIKFLKEIAAKRQTYQIKADSDDKIHALEEAIQNSDAVVMDELEDVICLPDWKCSSRKLDTVTSTELDPNVVLQLHDYVCNLVSMYRENPFHNFEHASHVTMSVVKLLSRIVQPDGLDDADDATLHDHSYGLTSDPLTQFSCVLSALVHDADHQGVPNATLIEESAPIASHYKNKSIAEQRSVDCSWELLQEERYRDLRRAIYSTTSELKRFRQLIVTCVLSTDIADKGLSANRKNRWKQAFAEESPNGDGEDLTLARNRKATIVLEHLMQASDVSHTMQHWHVYRRWNEKFFLECMESWEEGRSKSNPADSWFKGEIGFFDFYIIPLAKKLKECGVFGVSSDEYLNYAVKNRDEWEARGQEVVHEMLEKLKQEQANTGIEKDVAKDTKEGNEQPV